MKKYKGKDFYQFSCGGYIKNKKIPDHNLYISTFSELNKKLAHYLIDIIEQPIDVKEPSYVINAKKFYRSCMNEGKIYI